MSVACECCELSGTGLCDGLVTRPEEFYRVSECNHEASIMWRAWPTWGLLRHGKKKCVLSGRGLCVGLITRPEESYRVSECNCEASIMWRASPTRRLLRHGKKRELQTYYTSEIEMHNNKVRC
jgi:hypothetical protein